jgi:hypothetical protein
MNTDEQLILAFQTGSRESFAELFERYREPVLPAADRSCGAGGRIGAGVFSGSAAQLGAL